MVHPRFPKLFRAFSASAMKIPSWGVAPRLSHFAPLALNY